MEDLNNAFGDILRACQDYSAGQIQMVVRDENESPVMGVFATVEPELALLLESTIRQYDEQNSESYGTGEHISQQSHGASPSGNT